MAPQHSSNRSFNRAARCQTPRQVTYRKLACAVAVAALGGYVATAAASVGDIGGAGSNGQSVTVNGTTPGIDQVFGGASYGGGGGGGGGSPFGVPGSGGAGGGGVGPNGAGAGAAGLPLGPAGGVGGSGGNGGTTGAAGGNAPGANGGVGGNGGQAGNVTSNTVTINGATTNGTVFGGYSAGGEGGNGGDGDAGAIPGGVGGNGGAAGTATHNVVNMLGGTVDGVIGGASLGGDGGKGGSNAGANGGNGGAAADASDNSVTISGGSVQTGVFGGATVGGLGGQPGSGAMGPVFEGADGASGNASNNSVTISGSASVGAGVAGGVSETGTASGNSVFISGNASIGSGCSSCTMENGEQITIPSVVGGAGGHAASGNTVTISGSPSILGNVVGGYGLDTGSATNNRIILEGTPTFGTGSVLYGGFSVSGGAVSGNTLEVHTQGLTLANMHNFARYDFLLPSNIQPNATVLSLTDTAGTNLGGAQVAVGLQSGPGQVLKAGDRVALVHNTHGVDSSGVTQTQLTGYQGIALEYKFDLSKDPNNLYAVVDGVQVQDQSKAPVEGRAGNLALTMQGSDLISGSGMENAVAAAGAGGGHGVSGFGAFSGGSSRYNTGSHVNVDGASLMLGAAKRFANRAGGLTAGVFFESGWSRYDTYNDFTGNTVHGTGSARYTGGGVLARQDWSRGWYTEASVRAGQVSSDWRSTDMNVPDASYDSSTPYYGAHVGVGRVWTLTGHVSLDTSAKFFWTHQNSEDVSIAGSPYHFDSEDSQRTRLGARLNYAFNDHMTGYVGAAWEHEFDAVARATVSGLDTASPSLKGDTGVFEVGFMMKPSAKSPLTVGLGVQGYAGKREGVSGTLNASWAF